ALLACRAPRAPQKAHEQQRKLVIISIDGLRADAFAHDLKVPNLRSLVARGTLAEGVTSVWPTVTYPAHTTLVTGAKPAQHGILNNGPFDPFGKNLDGWYWYARDIRVPTLWDVAHEHGLTTANVYWPVTVGARFDWSFPQIWRSRTDEDDKLMAALATPGLFDEVRGRYGRTPAEHRGDDARADAMELILQEKKPDLSFFYLTDLDTSEHGNGPFSAAANATLEGIDTQVGRLIEATKKAGTFEHTVFAVVSDHGFLPITKVVKPNVLLRAAGLLDVQQGRVTAFRAVAWKSGGTCAIMLRDPSDAIARESVTTVFREAASLPESGIGKVHEASVIAAKGGFPGATLVLEARDGYAFANGVEGPAVEDTDERGAHGYSPDRPELRATFLVAGPGIAHETIGVIDMTEIAPRLAGAISLPFAKPGAAK
ncbi:MAG: alkaline phosphatase family protein, partial [Polyangiales bacterium]